MFKFIALNKKLGESSFSALGKVKKYFGTKKVGHLGTLDPLAEGVLAVAIGDATKLIPYVETTPKEYVVEIFFGFETETLDAEGIDKKAIFGVAEKVDFLESDLLRNLELLKEQEMQFPPNFSAIKIEGKRAYDLARKGELDVSKIKAKPVRMLSYDLLDFSLPIVKLKIETSSGYYVRSLVRDLAIKLGVKAFMYSLLRTRVGGFDLANCSDFDSDEILEFSVCDVVKDFHRVNISIPDKDKLHQGLPLSGIEIEGDFDVVYVFCENELVSLAKVDRLKKEISPIKNFKV